MTGKRNEGRVGHGGERSPSVPRLMSHCRAGRDDAGGPAVADGALLTGPHALSHFMVPALLGPPNNCAVRRVRRGGGSINNQLNLSPQLAQNPG